MKRTLPLVVALAGTLFVTSCSAQSSDSAAPTVTETPSASASVSVPASPPATVTSSGGSNISLGGASSAVTAPAVSPTGKAGIATDAQMEAIDRVARAIANEKYSDAAAAGYAQDSAKLAELRAKHADYFDKLKAEYTKGDCHLVPEKVNSSRVIYTNMTCGDGSAPDVSVHAQFMNNALYYLDATYVGAS